MAISPTTGSAANDSSGAATSKALPAFNLTAGQDVGVVVALGSTASSVTSITDTKGNSYTLKSSKNGTGVRTEVWESHNVGAQVGNIITVNFSPATTMAAAAEEYASVNSAGNTGTASGSDVNPFQRITMQDGNNFGLVGIGFACQSGDTLTAKLGTSRQSSIPAATAVGVALYDNTMLADGDVSIYAQISTARQWATAGIELRSGSAAEPVAGYPAANEAALQAARDVRYLKMNMPLGGGGGILPPGNDGQIFPPSIS